MNRDKALRIFFPPPPKAPSELGLMQSFEQRLKTDTGLKPNIRVREHIRTAKRTPVSLATGSLPISTSASSPATSTFEQEASSHSVVDDLDYQLGLCRSVAATLIPGHHRLVERHPKRPSCNKRSSTSPLHRPTSLPAGCQSVRSRCSCHLSDRWQKTIDVKSIETGKLVREIELIKEGMSKLGNPGTAGCLRSIPFKATARMVVALSGTAKRELRSGGGTLCRLRYRPSLAATEFP